MCPDHLSSQTAPTGPSEHEGVGSPVFPDSAEMVINDFTRDGTDDLIVVDVRTGDLLDRVDTGSRVANGMFLTAGGNRDVFYCTTLCVARVTWQ